MKHSMGKRFTPISHYLSAYAFATEGGDTSFFMRAGKHLQAINDSEFNPVALGLPEFPADDLFTVAMVHKEAALAILHNPYFAKQLTEEQRSLVTRQSFRASVLVLLKRSVAPSQAAELIAA